MVGVLKEKDNNVLIWCHADQFAKKTGLVSPEYARVARHSDESYCIPIKGYGAVFVPLFGMTVHCRIGLNN